MPDISMCTNTTCPKRSDCYRYRVVPNEYRQSYGDFKHTEEAPCRYFSKVIEGDPLVPTGQVDKRWVEVG